MTFPGTESATSAMNDYLGYRSAKRVPKGVSLLGGVSAWDWLPGFDPYFPGAISWVFASFLGGFSFVGGQDPYRVGDLRGCWRN